MSFLRSLRRSRAPEKAYVGAVSSFRHDGIDLARRRKVRRGLPVREIALFTIVVMCIKLVTFAEIGPAGYAQRTQQLFEGNFMEKVTAQAMKLDPATRALGGKLRSLKRRVSSLVDG